VDTIQLNIAVSAYPPERLEQIRQVVLLHDKGFTFIDIGAIQERPSSSTRNDYRVGKKFEALDWPTQDGLRELVDGPVKKEKEVTIARRRRLAYCCWRCDIIRSEGRLAWGQGVSNPYPEQLCDCCWVEIGEALRRDALTQTDRRLLAKIDEGAFGYLVDGLAPVPQKARKGLRPIRNYRQVQARPYSIAPLVQRCDTCALAHVSSPKGAYDCEREHDGKLTDAKRHVCDGWRGGRR
jgi:hypothetical protein